MNKNLVMEFKNVVLKTDDGTKEFTVSEEKAREVLQNAYDRMMEELYQEKEKYELQEKMKNFIYDENKLLAGDEEQVLYLFKSIVNSDIAENLDDIKDTIFNIIKDIKQIDEWYSSYENIFKLFDSNKNASCVASMKFTSFLLNNELWQFILDLIQGKLQFSFRALSYSFKHFLSNYERNDLDPELAYFHILNLLFKLELYKDPIKALVEYKDLIDKKINICIVLRKCNYLYEMELMKDSLEEIFIKIYDNYGEEFFNYAISSAFESVHLRNNDIEIVFKIINFMADKNNDGFIIRNSDSVKIDITLYNKFFENNWRVYLDCNDDFIELFKTLSNLFQDKPEWKYKLLVNPNFISFIGEFSLYKKETNLKNLSNYIALINNPDKLIEDLNDFIYDPTKIKIRDIINIILSFINFGVYIENPEKIAVILKKKYPEIFDEIYEEVKKNEENSKEEKEYDED